MSSSASDVVENVSTLEEAVKQIDILTIESEMLCWYMYTHLEEAETQIHILTMESEMLCLYMSTHLKEAVSDFEKEKEKHETTKSDLEVEKRKYETMKSNFEEEKGKYKTAMIIYEKEKGKHETAMSDYEKEKGTRTHFETEYNKAVKANEVLTRQNEQFMSDYEKEKGTRTHFETEYNKAVKANEVLTRQNEQFMSDYEKEKGTRTHFETEYNKAVKANEVLTRQNEQFMSDYEKEKGTRTHFETEYNKAVKANEVLTRQNEQFRVEANNNQLDRCAIGFIPMYFLVATTFCYYNRDKFQGMETGSVFTILYFVVVVTLSVGYGDVVPIALRTKLFTCLLVAIGGQVSQCLISLQSYAWRKVKDMFPQNISEAGRKVITFCLALIAIIISVLVGMLGFLYFGNGKGVGKLPAYNLNGTDAFYASMMSLSTEGFGDYSFRTEHGRVFAVFWLLICVPMYVSALTHVVKVIVSWTGCFYSF